MGAVMTAAEQQGDSCAGYTDTFLKVNVKKKWMEEEEARKTAHVGDSADFCLGMMD